MMLISINIYNSLYNYVTLLLKTNTQNNTNCVQDLSFFEWKSDIYDSIFYLYEYKCISR